METHLRCEGSEGKVLKMDRPFRPRVVVSPLRAMSFIVSHLSSIPEHAPPLNITMSADAPIVISTEAKRSGEISLHHGS